MINNYISLLRLNQVIKHIFVIPGIIFGYFVSKNLPSISLIVLSFISIILVASSNYIMNEITDKNFDKHHQLKKNRTMITKSISQRAAWIFYIIILLIGILLALIVNKFFFLIIILFSLSGMTYNLQPLRLKDVPILDVISESFNNPIRFLLGFSIFFNEITIPSLSLLISYWFAGAFLMNSKRISEYKYFIHTKKIKELIKYRTVYSFYNFENLNSLSMFYSVFSVCFLSIFIIKHRIEYIVLVPIIILIFSRYHFLTLKKFILMQDVKNLIKFKVFIFLIFLLIFLFPYLTFYEIEILSILIEKKITIVF